MRKTLAFALWAAVAWPSAARDQSTQERLARHFSAQYSVCPGTKVSVTPAPEIGISGYEAFGASAAGFVSQDGAPLLIGESRPWSVPPEVFRERLLSESPGVRPQTEGFVVTAFIDFQCEKCRLRTPRLRDFVWAHGGALEIRFLPLVKVHDWAFAAAASASALANVSPALYTKYEEAIFPRAGDMNGKTARELAADVADSAGARETYARELSSGRARERIVRDIDLALRLGLNGTPIFFYRGAQLSSEPQLAEDYVASRLGGEAGASDKDARR